MWIKIILIVAIIIIASAVVTALGARQQAIRRLFVIAFGLFAAASVLLPDVWTTFAHAVGVGRGTDLLLYSLVIAFLSSLVTNYLTSRRHEANLTIVARRLALDETVPAGQAAAERVG